MGQSMNSPSPAVREMMRATINRSSSSSLLPAEWPAFHAEGSGIVNIPRDGSSDGKVRSMVKEIDGTRVITHFDEAFGSATGGRIGFGHG